MTLSATFFDELQLEKAPVKHDEWRVLREILLDSKKKKLYAKLMAIVNKNCEEKSTFQCCLRSYNCSSQQCSNEFPFSSFNSCTFHRQSVFNTRFFFSFAAKIVHLKIGFVCIHIVSLVCAEPCTREIVNQARTLLECTGVCTKFYSINYLSVIETI